MTPISMDGCRTVRAQHEIVVLEFSKEIESRVVSRIGPWSTTGRYISTEMGKN